MSGLETRFLDKLGEEWEDATPGFCLQAYRRGRKIADLEVGKTYRYYDWASLTKIVFSTTSLMFAVDEKKLRVNDRISKWVSWFPESSPWRVRDLLSHSAGMTWWYPFYKDVAPKTQKGATPEEAWRLFEKILKRKVLADLRGQDLSARARAKVKAVYSDVDFFLLGLALEAIREEPLHWIWNQTRDRLGLEDVDFHRENRPLHSRKLYAPTEKDAWRGKLIQGEVHDENTWSLRGVAPHAGLFGTIDSLSQWGLHLRQAMRGGQSRVLGPNFPSSKTVQLFTRRSIPRTRGDWALGFMMPSKGTASCGSYFSLKSVGHTGFTGTSIWYDPQADLLVTIVSNRVHPTRENKKFILLRPRLHNLLCEAMSR